MQFRSAPGVVLAAFLFAVSSACGDAQVRTPRLVELETLTTPSGEVLFLRAPVPGVDWSVGLAVSCVDGAPRIDVELGAFAARSRVFQLAVRAPDGAVETFGPSFRADMRSGFHSPRLEAADDVARFVAAAFRPGALVSNGYNSFFFQAAPNSVALLRAAVADCGPS